MIPQAASNEGDVPMWPTLSSLRLALSGKAPRRPAFRRLACRPRLEALEDRCLLNAGALDPTFGSGTGYVTTSLSPYADAGYDVLLQPSGNIVVAGETNFAVTTKTKHGTTTSYEPVFGAVTYNPDGSLDTAFGSGGIVAQPFAGNASGSFYGAAALEPMGAGDDKILLGGQDNNGNFQGMALIRLNANGTLDTTFGSNGQVITPIQTPSGNPSGEVASSVAVTSGGQILAVGNNGNDGTVVMARYNPNGSLDPTFGSGGTATFTAPGTNIIGWVYSMALQSDGKFVVTGKYGAGSVTMGLVLRFNANGSPDTTFGNGGMVTTALPAGANIENFRSVAVYPSTSTANAGKIVVDGGVNISSAGVTTSHAVVERFNPDGSVDTTFGNGAGYVIIPAPPATAPIDSLSAVAIESDGKLILAGVTVAKSTAPGYSLVARLNVDGSPDATFGNGGLVTTAIGTPSQFRGVAIQPDGKILTAGDATVGGKTVFSLARYLPSEPEVGSFAAGPDPVTSGSSTTLTASNITDGNPAATITQVAFYVQVNGSNTLLGYGTQSSPGVWTFSFTVSLAPGSYTLFAQAEDSDGVFGDLFALTFTVQ
jgi:uncharacterized delta-60 repeat protein